MKVDNFAGDDRINRIVARLATEYEVPPWNYWRAVQLILSQGLEEAGIHLT